MPHLLIIEDDDEIRARLLKALRDLGHVVDTAPAGLPGLERALAARPDLVVLDLGLPDVDGSQVLAMLRAVSEVPVIIASARDDDPSLVRALDSGADDYLVKPFTTAQLDARIRAVLRRSGAGPEQSLLVVGGLEIDPRGRRTTLEGREIELTPKEFDLLAYLAERAGEVVTKKELLTEVWQQPWGGSDKTVDVHLSWLRRKLGESATEPGYLTTVRGVGIRLSAPSAS
ncbi:response regulator transcription factor [Nocardioides sp.]|uniref:response regulator transcription factor n=1 Tax=Nocardioides sp. TaxID=35761 RepID=UPI0039E47984